MRIVSFLCLGAFALVLVPNVVHSRYRVDKNYGKNLQNTGDTNIKYVLQYQLVKTVFGSYYRAVYVPVRVQTTTTTTTTTTRTPAPPLPPPVVSPTIYFSYANYIPMNLYSTYICGIYRPRTSIYRKPQQRGKRLANLASLLAKEQSSSSSFDGWLRKRRTRGRSGSRHRHWFNNEKYARLPDTNDRNKGSSSQETEESEETMPGGRAETQEVVSELELMIQDLKQEFVEGYQPEEEIASALSDLTSDDLDIIFEAVYGFKKEMAEAAVQNLKVFYANDSESSAVDLAEDDMKRLLIDIIMAANGRMDCPECSVNYNTEDDIAEVVASRLLPFGLSYNEQVAALDGIKFMADLNLTSEEATNIFENFVDDFVTNYGKEEEEEEEEVDVKEDYKINFPNNFFYKLINALGRHKRQTSNLPQFDTDIACFLLNNYMIGSTYCGVRMSARLVYSRLQCFQRALIVPTNPEPAAAPSTTTTSTTSTTTTTPTTTTTTSTSTTTPTTTTATSTSTTTPTTTTTASTSTTTTTTTTTTPKPTTTTLEPTTTAPEPTTTTPEPTTTTTAPLEDCGVSDIAKRAAVVTSSNLLIAPRIVGGAIAGTCTAYPWMVRLTIDSIQVCGGAILDETHILTAAHCVINKNSIQATVGEYDSSIEEGTEQNFDVDPTSGVSIHPDFNFFQRTNDIAIVTLDEPIDTSRICASPICVDPTFKVESGQECTIAGWGATSENSFKASSTLMTTPITTYNGSDCLNLFPNAGSNYFTDLDKQLCAGDPDVGGVDACGGDSGGPLMCLNPETNQYVVAGIVSYGEGCGRATFPGVYGDTSVYADWINSEIGGA